MQLKPARIFIFIFFSFVICHLSFPKETFFVISSPVSAAEPTPITIPVSPAPWFQQDYVESSRQVREGANNPEDVHKFLYDTSTLNNMVNSFNIALGGFCTDDACTKTQGGAIRQLAGIMGSIYSHPPASGLAWLGQTIQDFGLAPKVYAQGIGFAGLAPLLPLWRISRNIAYALIILVMVVIGLMIMFRAKIDPKTVISVQQAIPKIIVAILLITFSYPIAGFMIDLMYVVILAALTLLLPTLEKMGVSAPPDLYLTGGLNHIWTLMWGFIDPKIISGGIAGIVGFILGAGGVGLGGLFGGVFLGPLGPIVGAAFGLLAGGLVTGSLAGLLSPIILLLFALTVIFIFIRILFLLINSYIQILLSIIFAPLQLLSEAIPGQSSFSNWIKNLIANLLVFPTTIIIMLIAQVINTSLHQGGGRTIWTPPLLGGSIPIIGLQTNDVAIFLISVGFFGMIPTLAGAVKDMLKAKPALPVGAGAAVAPFWSGFQTATGVLQQFYYMKMMFPGKPKAGGGGRA